MEREIPEDHSNMLKVACGIEEQSPLPKKLVESYWKMARLSDRISDTLTPADLKHIAFSQGHGTALDREINPSVVTQFRAGRLTRNETRVSVAWGKGRKEGVLKDVRLGRVHVQLDGDADERIFEDAEVKIAA